MGGHAPFVGGGREDVKAAWVWETKLHGLEGGDGGPWLVVGLVMLLFVVSRGCTVCEWGKGRAGVRDIVSGVGGRGGMGFLSWWL